MSRDCLTVFKIRREAREKIAIRSINEDVIEI